MSIAIQLLRSSGWLSRLVVDATSLEPNILKNLLKPHNLKKTLKLKNLLKHKLLVPIGIQHT